MESREDIFKSNKQSFRRISENSFRILDSPEYTDDFYTHLLDWNINGPITIGI